ncbi:MAG: sacsin N-terminal ATP-binding-like domain-containing protein [Actinomycetes bacterium]
MADDAFGTAAIRGRVLDGWQAATARFREDANAEEDLVRGGYRDRVLVELAANAADAAIAARVAGRLRFELVDDALIASNVGAPLDAAGVEALCTLRASAKRDPDASVGRYGVGFAAVLAVSDEPAMASRTGGLRWSADEARRVAGELPGVAAELARRDGSVPVLRLPFPADAVDAEWDTVVTLPLRDADAHALVRRLLDDIDAALLLTLPGLSAVEVVVGGTVRRLTARRDGRDVLVEDSGEVTRWRTATRVGRVAAQLLADRPVEERAQSVVSATWAVPVDVTGRPALMPSTVPAVVHAPAPTDEPLDLSALLIATLPLDPSRRHAAPGPLRDHVLGLAATAYADLLSDLSADPSVLDLVPTGFAAGEVDAVLRREILELLPDTPLLDGVRPADAVIADVSPAATAVLTDVIAGLLPPDWARRQAPLAVLGVRLLSLADVVEVLATLDRPPRWWHELYAGLMAGHLGAVERDALGALPVPLADRRLVTGPRGLLLPTPEVGPDTLVAMGLRAVDAAAAHPLLLTLGAVAASPQAVIEDPAVQAAVARSYDDGADVAFTDAVLGLVSAADLRPGELPWLADLALLGADGEMYPAGELLMPHGPLAQVVHAGAPFGVVSDDLVKRWGEDVLAAAGVLSSFAVVRDVDVVEPAYDLDGEHDWWSTLPEGAAVTEFLAVRDLELVDPSRWSDALALLAQPPLRDAVLTPAYADLGGPRAAVPSYTAWWLSTHPVLDRLRPRDVMVGGLGALYDAAPDVVDAEFLRAIGVWAGLDDIAADVDGLADLLARLGDASRPVDRDWLPTIYAAVARSPVARDIAPPDLVRGLRDGEVVVARSSEAVVVDAPDLLPLMARRAVVPVGLSNAVELAEVLALPFASDFPAYEPVSTGEAVDDHVVHDPLLVSDIEGTPQHVAWRWLDGVLHVDAGRLAFGLGRGRAWRTGDWQRRHLVTALLERPEDETPLRAEADLD